MFTGRPEHIKASTISVPDNYEHTLRNDEAALSVARYILENPIRAGLVTRIEDYPYSGSSLYSIEQILEAIQLRDKWYRRSG
jgi:hypothetical protein